MSTSVVTFSPDMPIPAYLQGPSALQEAIATLPSTVARPKISIEGGRFRLIEDGEETVLDTFSLGVVVVGLARVSHKAWYAESYVKGVTSIPNCASSDGVRPDASSPNKQSDLCATCPKNAWGSANIAGSQAKACADRRRIAVVDSTDLESGTMYEVDIPSGSIGNFSAYAAELQRMKICIEKIITIIAFDPNASGQKLTFKFGGGLPQDQVHLSVARTHSAESKETVRDIALTQPAPAALAAPVSAPQAVTRTATMLEAIQQVQTAPVQEVLAPAAQPAPAPVKGFGKKKGAASAVAQPAAQPVAVVQTVAAPAMTGNALADLEAELAQFTGTDD